MRKWVLAAVFGGLAACGAGQLSTPDAGPSDAGVVDAGERVVDSGPGDAGAPDAGPTDGGSDFDAGALVDAGFAQLVDDGGVIQAPPDQWAWVSFPQARCANGSTTGIAVRVHPGSKRLLLYLEGGGSCDSAAKCWGDVPSAQNVNGYGPEQFAAEPSLTAFALFDTKAGTGNPFADANLVYVPYCTGDTHVGRAKVDFVQKDGGAAATWFVGAQNLELYLSRVVPTFAGVDHVWLVGTSAGGGGVLFNFAKVKHDFAGARVDAIDDSYPGFEETDGGYSARLADRFALWGAQPPFGCTTCTSALKTFDFDRSLEPAGNYAFMSFQFDDVAARVTETPLADFGPRLVTYAAVVSQTPRTNSFVVKNGKNAPQHVVLSKTLLAPDLIRAADEFVTKMANDASDWADATYP